MRRPRPRRVKRKPVRSISARTVSIETQMVRVYATPAGVEVSGWWGPVQVKEARRIAKAIEAACPKVVRMMGGVA